MEHRFVIAEKEASKLINEEKYSEAVVVLEQLLAECPDWEHGEGWLMLADCYTDLGLYEKAEKAYNEALAQEPENATYLGNYAAFLAQSGRTKEAYNVGIKLHKIAPHFANSEAAMIKILHERGRSIGLTDEQINDDMHRTLE